MTVTHFAQPQYLIPLFMILCGLIVRWNVFGSLLLFSLIYPLIPSRLQQIGFQEFSAAEFLFLCFCFWWIIMGRAQTQNRALARIKTPLVLYAGLLCISAFLGLLSIHFVFSRIFLEQLRENWNLLGPFTPTNPMTPLRALLTQVEGILFFLITVSLVDSKIKARQLIQTIYYSSIAVAILGLLQYQFHFRLLPHWLKENPNLVRINATFDDPNALGAYLAVAVCLGIFSIDVHRLNRSWLRNVPIIILVSAEILTASRSGIAALFLLVFALPLALRFMKIEISKPVIIQLLIWALPLLILRLVLSGLPDDPFLKGRPDLWALAFRFFLESPVFGIGAGMFFFTVSSRPYDFASIRSPENVHNYYLQILAENGIAGLILFLTILFILLAAGFRAIRKITQPEDRNFCYGILASILVILITSLTGHPLLLVKLQYMFWGLAAVLMVLCSQQELSTTGGRIPRLIWMIPAFLILIALPWKIQSILHKHHFDSYEAGYYDWERGPDGQLFRWTREEAFSDLPVQGKILSLSFRQIDPDVAKKPYLVSLYLDDQPLDQIKISNSEWKKVQYSVPSSMGVGTHGVRPRIHFRIKLNSTFSPKDYGFPDTRELGIQMRPFSWECISDSQEETAHLGKPFTWSVSSSHQETRRLSLLSVSPAIPPADFDLITANGEILPYNSKVAEFPLLSGSTLLYPETTTTSSGGYRVSSRNSLIRKCNVSGNILFRIVAEASPKTALFPVLIISANKTQKEKLPIFLLDRTAYLIQIPIQQPQTELSFSTNSQTEILISEIRMWNMPASPNPEGTGWMTVKHSSEVFFDSNLSKPRPLIRSGDSFEVERNWKPGVVSLSLNANGMFAGPEFPQLGIYLGFRKVASITIDSPEPKLFKSEFPIGGYDRLRLVYENDFYDPANGKDRNIILNYVAMDYRDSVIVSVPVHNLLLPDQTCLYLQRKGM